MVEQLRTKPETHLLLTPNRSLGWRGNVGVLLSLNVLFLVIAAGMFWAGAWVVLPFVGLELAALAVALYVTARKCWRQEVLVITSDTLRLEKGVYRKQDQWELPRRYTRIQLGAPRHPWTPPVLSLKHRDTEVELAPFLNLKDTQVLVGILEKNGLSIEKQYHSPLG